MLQSMGRKESETTERLNNNEVCHNFSPKEQVSFNFMAAVTICSDFWSPRILSKSLFPYLSLSSCHEVKGQDAMILVF